MAYLIVLLHQFHKPRKCKQLLNAPNHGVCGINEQGIDYDAWKDSQGNVMPWITQQVYEEGQVIDVYTHFTANHAGHMTIRGCADGSFNSNCTSWNS